MSSNNIISFAILIGICIGQFNGQSQEDCNLRLSMKTSTLEEGKPVRFSCISKKDCNYSKIWYINNEHLKGAVINNTGELNVNTLDLMPHRNQSGALLKCIVFADYMIGNITVNFTLDDVHYPPGEVTVTVGSAVCDNTCNVKVTTWTSYKFTCRSMASNPAYNIHWKIISSDSRETIVESSHQDYQQLAAPGGGWDATSEFLLGIKSAYDRHKLICSVLHPDDTTYREVTISLSVDQRSLTLILLTTVACAVALLIVCCMVVQFVKHALRRLKQRRGEAAPSRSLDLPERSLTTEFCRENMEGNEPAGVSFPRERIRMMNVIGEGLFGLVYRARADGILEVGKKVTVAVKTLKSYVSSDDVSAFMKELDVCKTLQRHPNIIQLLGSCTDKKPFFLIFEFAENGDLKSFLREKRQEWSPSSPSCGNLTSDLVLRFACQIASGMEYLSALQIIHRDLATRNILLSKDLTCKLSDFGFSRDVLVEEQYSMKSNGDVPVRWMALESIVYSTYTTKSDVWSYAVLLWEILTLGSHPYPGLDVNYIITALQEGLRLPKPSHCSDKIYNVMKSCWSPEPSHRPDFCRLLKIMESFESSAASIVQMSKYAPDRYE